MQDITGKVSSWFTTVGMVEDVAAGWNRDGRETVGEWTRSTTVSASSGLRIPLQDPRKGSQETLQWAYDSGP